MQIRGTTIIAVRRDGKITLAGDGQVTIGERCVLKGTAVKVRRIYDGKVVIEVNFTKYNRNRPAGICFDNFVLK